MPSLATLKRAIRHVPPLRLVTGNRSLRPPLLYALWVGSTGFRYVTLCRPPTMPQPSSISHVPHEGLVGRKHDPGREQKWRR